MARIYLDHAATTPLDNEILQKMLPYFTEEFGNADSPHATGRKAMNAVDFARDKIAELLHAKPNEVFFTSGGTEADHWALHGGAYAAKEKGKTHVIVSSIEHHAVLAAAEKLQKEGFQVTYLPVNEQGVVTVETLEEALTENTGLVAVMAANNETGVLQPIKELAEITHRAGAVFFTDAVQAAPHIAIDVKDLGVDMLAFSSHKIYGPKGCGVLYIKNGVKVKGLIVGGEQERGLRGGTTNVPAVVGMSAAYEKTVKLQLENDEKIRDLRKAFLEELSAISGLQVNGEGVAAVLNLRVSGVSNVDLVFKSDLEGICIAGGSACASASIKPSHVLLAMGRSEQEAKECIRVSFGRSNTEAEVREAAKILCRVIEKLRNE